MKYFEFYFSFYKKSIEKIYVYEKLATKQNVKTSAMLRVTNREGGHFDSFGTSLTSIYDNDLDTHFLSVIKPV